MSYLSSQFWVNALKTFTAKVTNGTIYANDPNEISDEVEAIERILGTGLLSRTAQAWSSTATSWTSLTSRLLNIDAGVRTTDVTVHPQYVIKSGALVQPADTTSVAMTVQGNTGNSADLVRVYATDGSSLLTLTQTTAAIGKQTTITGGLVIASGGATIAGSTVITSSGASAVPLISKGASGQTGDLIQAQNSSGSTLFAVGASGSVTSTGLTNTGTATLTTSSPSTVPLVAKGAASQTADVMQVQSSSGGILAKVDASGGLTTAGGVNPLSTSTLKAADASHVPAIIKGASAQTADLSQWQSSASSVLARIDASGNGFFANLPNTVVGGSSVLTTNSSGGVTLDTGLSVVSMFVAWNGDAGARANMTIGNNRGRWPTGGYQQIGITCLSGATAAPIANLPVRIDWLAIGTL